MKIAPIMRVMRAYPQIEPVLVHTGQHYDGDMSDAFLECESIKLITQILERLLRFSKKVVKIIGTENRKRLTIRCSIGGNNCFRYSLLNHKRKYRTADYYRCRD